MDGVSAAGALDLARIAARHFGSTGCVHVAPRVPQAKAAAARARHREHLPDSERIVVLYDDTLFGGGDEGFVATRERLCWKNFLEHPRQLRWAELDPATVSAGDRRVHVAGGRIDVCERHLTGPVARFLADVATRARLAHPGPYRGAGGHAGAHEALVTIARSHGGEVDGLYFAPAIPRRKLERARRAHAPRLGEDDTVAVLYDDTLFGSAEHGFLLTSELLCWSNVLEAPRQIPWVRLSSGRIRAVGGGVRLDEHSVVVSAGAGLARRLASMLEAIVRSRQAG